MRCLTCILLVGLTIVGCESEPSCEELLGTIQEDLEEQRRSFGTGEAGQEALERLEGIGEHRPECVDTLDLEDLEAEPGSS